MFYNRFLREKGGRGKGGHIIYFMRAHDAETDLKDGDSEKRGGFRVYQRIMPQF